MNVLNNKKSAINHQALQTSLDRDMAFALDRKPSLDGLKQIENTQVEKPFLNSNLDLDIENNLLGKNGLNQIVENQINTAKQGSLNSKTVGQVVRMKYQNNNGVTGEMKKITLQQTDDNIEVVEEVQELPITKPVVNQENDNQNDTQLESESENLKLEIENLKTVSNSPALNLEVRHPNNNLQRSLQEMTSQIYSNKVLALGVIILILLSLGFFIGGKKVRKIIRKTKK